MKKNTKNFVTIFVLAILFYIVARLFYYPNNLILQTSAGNNITNKSAISQVKTDKAKIFKPKLIVPSVGIDADILSVGITRKGNMSTPNSFSDVGLYKYGAVPGELGSAVIAGHVNNKIGLKAVFGNLNKLKKGDDIYVEIEPGKKQHFVVTSISLYDFNANAPEVFNQNDNAYLKLITCSGVWVPEIRTHNKRLVVTAVKV